MTTPKTDTQARLKPSFLQHVLARVRQKQLVLARAGRVRESSYFARWAQRVRAVARGFEASAPGE